MKTIPLQPVFENEKFNDLFPACRYYVIEAIYLLAKARKLDPLPPNLRMYFKCSNPHYWRFKQVFRDILEETIPEMYKAKNIYKKNTVAGNIGQSKRCAERRLLSNRKEQFSDEKVNHCEINAVPSPPGKNQYHQGQYDHVARKQAIDNNKKDKDVWFTDN